MTTSKLSLYNGALLKLGEIALSSLSETRQARRDLDRAWDDGAVDYCLEAGQWKFAMRSTELTYSPSITPGFGFTYGFDKPTDHKKLAGVFQDANMQTPLRDYREEAGFWFANIDTIYIRYVSNDSDYGMDFSLWPQRFSEFVQAHLAAQTALSITGGTEKRDDMIALRDRKLLPEALSYDAMQESSKYPQVGRWVRARFNGGRDRENL